jgi:hypothetical protein
MVENLRESGKKDGEVQVGRWGPEVEVQAEEQMDPLDLIDKSWFFLDRVMVEQS